MRGLASLLLTCTLLMGLLLPRMGAVLVEVIPGLTQAVICTGDAMVVLVLDGQGQPVEIPERDSPPCLHADTPSGLQIADPTWHDPISDPNLGPANLARAPEGPRVFVDLKPAQAPPMQVV